MPWDDDTLRKLVGGAQVALGVGFFLKGIANWQSGGAAKAAGLADAESRGKPQGLLTKSKLIRVANIDERVKYIRDMIHEGSLHPYVRETAVRILSRKCGDRWCVREKDSLGEVSALFWAIRDPRSKDAIRYVRDHVAVDQFTSAEKTLKLHGEDCDGGTITLGAMLRTVGYPLKMRVVQAKGASTWSHIFLLAGLPPTKPTRWVPLDWSVTTASPGWEAPGSRQVALTGRPSGMIERLRDFDV